MLLVEYVYPADLDQISTAKKLMTEMELTKKREKNAKQQTTHHTNILKWQIVLKPRFLFKIHNAWADGYFQKKLIYFRDGHEFIKSNHK